MADKTIRTVHTCVVGKKSEGGKTEFVSIPPGTVATMPGEHADEFVRMKAATEVRGDAEKEQVLNLSEVEGDPVYDDEEAERRALLDEARAMGVEGLRRNSTIETIRTKMEEHQAKQADDVL